MKKYEKRAEKIKSLVELGLVDEHGLLRSAVNADTMLPFHYGFFDDKHYYEYPGRNWNDFADMISYENVGMSSGAYLAAICHKYKVSGDEKDLDIAARTFRGIVWLYKLSQQVEPGFYCKCYGGKLSREISSDQYIYTFAGLDEYFQLASSGEQDIIRRMIGEMVCFWMRKNYSYPYFGRQLNWPLERFPAFTWLAWIYTGEKAFMNEFQRLCEQPDVRKKIPFGRKNWSELLRDYKDFAPIYNFEKNSGKRILHGNGEHTASGWLSLYPMLKYDAPETGLWLKKAKEMLDRDRRFLEEDGSVGGCYLVDPTSGELSPVTEILHDGSGSIWKYFRLISGYRSGMWSATFARALVSMNQYIDEAELAMAAKILSKHDSGKLLWMNDPDKKQFPGDMKWMAATWSGDAATNWLWAYYEGRNRYGENWVEQNLQSKELSYV